MQQWDWSGSILHGRVSIMFKDNFETSEREGHANNIGVDQSAAVHAGQSRMTRYKQSSSSSRQTLILTCSK